MAGPHDRLLKRVLSNPSNAAAELRVLLPAELARRIDWSSLRYDDTTFVDDELRDRYADLVFEAKLDDNDAILYVLTEHLSEPDEFVRFRLLHYMVRIWERVLRRQSKDGKLPKDTKLPPIIPVLLLHSTTAEGAPRPPALRELVGVDDAVRVLVAPFVPEFDVLLEDLDRLPLQVLRARRLPPEVELMLFLLQRSRRSPALLEELRGLSAALEALARDPLGLATVVSYILEVREESPDDVREFFQQQLGPQGLEGFMTGAQQLTEQVRRASEAKGKAEGRAEGKAEGKTEGKAEAILRVLARRGVAVSEAQRVLVLGTTDAATLDRWLDEAIVAERAEDVFG